MLMAGMVVSAFGQGTEINLDNSNNTNASPTAVSSGLLFNPDHSLFTGDISATLMGGSSSSNLSPIVTLLSSGGTLLSGASLGAPGQFADLSGNAYNVPGVAPGGTAFLDLQVWTGSFATFQAAAAGGGTTGDSGVFSNPTGGGGTPPGAPLDLTGMPAFVVGPTPEPATLALCGLGAASLLLFRRKKN